MKRNDRLLVIEHIDVLEKINLNKNQASEKEAINYCIKRLKELLN